MNVREQETEKGLKLETGKVFPLIQSKCTISFGNDCVVNCGDTFLATPVVRHDILYGYDIKVQGRRLYLSLICEQCSVIGSVKVKSLKS